MTHNLLLGSPVHPLEQRVTELESENQELSEQVRDLQAELSRAKRENARAIAGLRATLTPLFNGLKVVFGEMDSISTDPAVSSETGNGKQQKWDAVKQRLAPRMREAIDVLMLQGSMRRTQLASALKMDYSNCNKNVIAILIRQGWIIDNNKFLSLKEL